jgi:hypothetical protein
VHGGVDALGSNGGGVGGGRACPRGRHGGLSGGALGGVSRDAVDFRRLDRRPRSLVGSRQYQVVDRLLAVLEVDYQLETVIKHRPHHRDPLICCCA